MKKIFLLLILVISFSVNAQKPYKIEKSLLLTTVDEGAKADSILVRGSDNIVKFISRSSFVQQQTNPFADLPLGESSDSIVTVNSSGLPRYVPKSSISSLPYKVYTASLNTSLGEVIATVKENTLGTIITWSKVVGGVYLATATIPIFNNAVIFVNCPMTSPISIMSYSSNSPEEEYFLYKEVVANTLVDGFSDISVEIRVYN